MFLRLIIVFMVIALGSEPCLAKKKRTVDNVRREQTATQKRIDETKRKINTNKSATEKNLAKLNLLRGEISQKELQISHTRQALDSLNSAIALAQDSLKLLRHRLENLKTVYTKALRKLQGTQYATGELGFVFSSESFSKAYARMRYVQEFSKWRKRKAEEIRKAAAEVEAQRQQLAQMQSQRASSLDVLSSDQAILKARQAETGELVNKLQRDGKNLKLALEKEQKRLKTIDNEITRMIEAERREREKAKKSGKNQSGKKQGVSSGKSSGKTSGKSGGTSTQPKSKIDNSDPDAAMTAQFAKHKGTMTFPVASPYRIVGKYGSSAGQPYNTGIEIVLDGSSSARCVYDGVVSRIFQNHDGNYSVMVRHGAYITVYYNIATLSVKAKDRVKSGQTIGTVAVDPRYGKPMLHFEVRNGSQTLNPMNWVK